MHRFYCQHADFNQKNLSITDRDEIHHIRDVLRLKAGDELFIFNGRNQEARAVIASVKEAEIVAAVEDVKNGPASSGVKLILACAVPKKAKFEFIVEKCTELGVHDIIPLKTKRTEVIYAADKMAAKQDRFQKVAINAAKQCGRVSVPTVHPMTALGDFLKTMNPMALALIPSLNGRPKHVRDVLDGAGSIEELIVLIGPEGDFTPDEVELAMRHGCIPVSLGTSVLKVDTAAIAAVALARFLYLK